MFELTDEQFDKLISEVMSELPQKYIEGLKNVAIVMADWPTDEQIRKLQQRSHTLLPRRPACLTSAETIHRTMGTELTTSILT